MMPELCPYEKLIAYVDQKKIHAESVKGILWGKVFENIKDYESMTKDYKYIRDSLLEKKITIKDCVYKGKSFDKTLFFEIIFSNGRNAFFKNS